MGDSSDPDSNLRSALAESGVVSASVDASTFQNYAGGIFTGDGCSNVNHNHAVTLVGYDSESFLLRNSWGVG